MTHPIAREMAKAFGLAGSRRSGCQCSEAGKSSAGLRAARKLAAAHPTIKIERERAA